MMGTAPEIPSMPVFDMSSPRNTQSLIAATEAAVAASMEATATAATAGKGRTSPSKR